MPRNTVINSKEELRAKVLQEIATHGPCCNLNHLDVSNLTDISDTFANTSFAGNISQWDTSLVENAARLFHNCPFNGDISNWNTSNLWTATRMFQGSAFNGDISNWNVAKLYDMFGMFSECPFNGDISPWDLTWTLRAGNLDMLFHHGSFAGDLSHWKVENPRQLRNAFNPNFKGVLPPVLEPARAREFYAVLLGGNDELHEYLHLHTFRGVHFDILRIALQTPEWSNAKEHAWVKQIAVLGTELGLSSTALHAYAMNLYRGTSKVAHLPDTYPTDGLVL